MKTSTCTLIGALCLSYGLSAQADTVTYQIDGNFASSSWNADGSNASRVPGGSISGYFTIDTDTLTVSEMLISTRFYSLYNNTQVMGATYNYGVAGMTNDWLGTNPATYRQISGIPSLPYSISLTTDLAGGTDVDGTGPMGMGSLIQIMDAVPAYAFGQRAFRPRISLFLEHVDFGSAAPTSPTVWVSEDVWNINIGNGIAGYSGAQSLTSMVATVPEAHSYAMMLAGLGLVGFVARRRLG